GIRDFHVTGVQTCALPISCVVLKPGRSLTEQELRGFVGARLARYKVPKHIAFAPALPKSGAGKVLKRDIADAFIARRLKEKEEEIGRASCRGREWSAGGAE